ncbi:MAG: hypothetical protein C5B51_16570 [Terriglobia bacterium]|nr:MAG: hypothetical protein C5B51_16570 [Terriglobia bacterium]
MDFRRFLLSLLPAIAAAQTVTISSPASSATLSGFSSPLRVSVVSAPNAYSLEYQVDGETIGYVDLSARDTTYTWQLNTWTIGNGSHSVKAVLRDALNATIATSAAVSFTIANGAETLSVATGTPVTSTWSGAVSIAPTVTNPVGSLTCYLFVDGAQLDSNNCTAAFRPLNTTTFSNGTHHVAVLVDDQSAAPNIRCCSWENAITFGNGTGHYELRVEPQEAVIAPTGTLQLNSPTLANSDGTTSSVTLAKYFTSDSTVSTVSSSGLITGVGFGSAQVLAMSTNPAILTTTQNGSFNNVNTDLFVNGCATLPNGQFYVIEDSEVMLVQAANPNALPSCDFTVLRGQFGTTAVTHSTGATVTIPFTRIFYEWITGNNSIYNFGSDGLIHQNYVSNSIWFASLFNGNSGFQQGDPRLPDSVYGPLYKAGGYTAYEPGIGPQVGTGEGAYATSLASFIATATGVGTTGLCPHPIGTPYLGGDNAAWASIVAPQGWASPAWTRLVTAWRNAGACGISGADEVNSSFYYPLPASVINAGGPFSEIDCVTDTCTVHWTGFDQNGAHSFGIFGATTNSGLNTTLGGSTYTLTKIDDNTFTFTKAGFGTHTVTASSDPGLRIEPFLTNWQTGNGYLSYVAFQTWVSQMAAASGGRLPITNPTAAASNATADYGWMGDPTVSDFGEYYGAGCPNTNYLPLRNSLNSLMTCPTSGVYFRTKWQNMKSNRLWLALSTGINATYWPFTTGQSINITSITDNIVTFASPHGIGSIVPSVTRIAISGTSSSYYNGNFLIDYCPTATSCSLSRYLPSDISGSGNNGTITFSDGSSFSLSSLASGSANLTSNQFAFAAGCAGGTKQGMTFTVSNANSGSGVGTYGSAILSGRFLYAPLDSYPCNSSQNRWREVPTGHSASGGSGVITPDNDYLMGRNATSGMLSMGGGKFQFASIVNAALLGAAGHRQYDTGIGSAPLDSSAQYAAGKAYPVLLFSNPGGESYQSGVSPFWEDGTGQVFAFVSSAHANLPLKRITKYLFQPRCGAPDLGTVIQTACRTGVNGTLLAAINLSDNAAGITVTLTPYLNGNAILRYRVSNLGIGPVATLSAGATSDSLTLDKGEAVFWVFPAASDYSAAPFSALLSDVPGASKIVIRYGYTAQMFSYPSVASLMLPQAADCGTGSCSIPVDRNIGPLYYRLLYLDVNGKILAIGGVQTL